MVPAWSPDGQSIAFVDAPRDRFAVFVIKPDGTGLRRLNPHCTFDHAWAPDSKRLVCVAFRRRPRPVTLEIVGLDGTVQRVLDRVSARSELKVLPGRRTARS